MTEHESATAVLRDQHKKILKVADVLEALLSPTPGSASANLDYDALADCVTFIRLYADALHHGKEEDLLFPELEGVGMSRQSGPIAVMLHEHEQGRAYAKAMADALEPARSGDEVAHRRLTNAALGYVALIRGHILKEDRVLFDMADQLIDRHTCAALCSAYEGVCQRRFDGCTVAELEAILERLTERYGAA